MFFSLHALSYYYTILICNYLYAHDVSCATSTKVFAKAGRDNVTSAMCKHQQRFGLDVQFSALVHNFSCIFSIGHLYRAGHSMNSLPSQILERWRSFPFFWNQKSLLKLTFQISLLFDETHYIYEALCKADVSIVA
jgi:hypothetical protein